MKFPIQSDSPCIVRISMGTEIGRIKYENLPKDGTELINRYLEHGTFLARKHLSHIIELTLSRVGVQSTSQTEYSSKLTKLKIHCHLTWFIRYFVLKFSFTYHGIIIKTKVLLPQV